MTPKTAAEPAPATSPAATWARLVATFFGIGHLRPGPGTWASVAAVAIWRALAIWLPSGLEAPIAAAIAGAVSAVGIPAATRVARASGNRDPSYVVIDEVAGQMLALIHAPPSLKAMLASLILFRAFDILKPPPLRRLEKLPGGLGIVADDIGAGLYAFVIMQLLLHYGVM